MSQVSHQKAEKEGGFLANLNQPDVYVFHQYRSINIGKTNNTISTEHLAHHPNSQIQWEKSLYRKLLFKTVAHG